ncbi:MAG: Uma2 family endonuclease [candidate division KSB1 bacterium]|nr:Uma2 family endonuclease [candidate division KSB1 bacterium]
MAEAFEEIIKEVPPSVIRLKKEYGMSPTGAEHSTVSFEIASFLKKLIKHKDYEVLFDVYRYLDPETANLFGNFKHAVNLESFINGLSKFGASKKFIQKKLDEFTGVGVIQGTYAPDICVISKEDKFNPFSIPVMVFEVISPNSREQDLYFKPYFYETIGVKELFICEASKQEGTVVKAYRLIVNEYDDIPLEKQGYFSEVLLSYLPKVWPL